MLRRFIVLNIFLFCLTRIYAYTSPQSFVLNGMIKGRDTGMIILMYPVTSERYVRDTTYLENGKFQFTGDIFQPSSSILKGPSGEGNIVWFYIEPGEQHIYLEENKFENSRITGSYTQKQNDTLSKQIKLIELKHEQWLIQREGLLKEHDMAGDARTKTEIEKRLQQFDKKVETLNSERLDKMVSFIRDHSNSYVSPSLLNGILTSNRLPTETVELIFARLSDRIKTSFDGILVSEELSKRRINRPAPDFVVIDIDNKQISLSQFKGKHVLINFWASWCLPCIKKIPELKQLLSQYQSKGFAIINISIDSKRENWIKAVKKYNLQGFHNVLTSKDIESKYSNTKMPIPSEILVGPTGLMAWNSMNVNSKALNDVLKECFIE